MIAFLLALFGGALATAGGREAVRVGQLATALGSGAGLLAAGWLASLAGCGVAAWLGGALAGQFPTAGRIGLAAIALLLAAGELALLRPAPAPAEPTRSFGAIALVLGVGQLASAASLIALALATTRSDPWAAGLGGAIGSGAVLTAAWALASQWRKVPRNMLRFTLAAALLATAALTALSARGVLG